MSATVQENIQSNDAQKALTKKEIVAGILSGQVAGLIMAVVVMIVFALFLGKNPLFPVQVIGSMALGESALQGTNILAVLVGVLLHQLGPALLWGFIFGLLASKLSVTTHKEALVLGLFVGVLSMVGPYFLIPTLMNALHGADYWNQNVPMFWDWAAHLVFGASLAIYPSLVKKI